MTNKFDNNTTPFGLLPKKDQEELRDLLRQGVGFKAWTSNSWYTMFSFHSFESAWVYRTFPKPKTKPSIDWSHVHEDYKWMATDKNGATFLYEEEPDLHEGFWEGVLSGPIYAAAFTSFVKGACDFKDSLVKRPEGETE